MNVYEAGSSFEKNVRRNENERSATCVVRITIGDSIS